MIRLAAVGDLHVGAADAGRLGPGLADVDDTSDALLLAGDLSRRGLPEEARILAAALGRLEVPVLAVLGNHDLDADRPDRFRQILADAGVTVLDGEATTVTTPDGELGVAGTIGFGGGFPGATCADFGEPEMKAFSSRSRRLGRRLRAALGEVAGADRVVALTHYAPVRATVAGEPPELYPFLGSHHLERAIDARAVDMALHGHAHHGSHEGRTRGGVPVRNVARPVLGARYKLFELPPEG